MRGTLKIIQYPMPRTRQLKDILRKINKNINPRSKFKELVQVDGQYCFWIHNGPVLKNLTDFNTALKQIGDDQFGYHANHDRNDFAAWIGDALKDPELAEKIRQVYTRDSAIAIVGSHLGSVYGITV